MRSADSPLHPDRVARPTEEQHGHRAAGTGLAVFGETGNLVEHGQNARGKLKIFFGAAPGVGKTFAMLESAQARQREGADVVVGVIETHGRAETAALAEGLETMPRGAEFDLDAALKRRPELIVIDELAHSNAKGSRHLKRWRDVEELLGAGIDVYSTLNVQHIESLNDVVAQITGVVVRETVPDSVLELANEIELVDLPVDELIGRMRAGKIYLPEQAERALEHFFRPGNLNALRELALRRTAERVDTDLVALRGQHGNAKTWPVVERLLLAIGPTPYAQNLVRATKRLATQWDAEWFVICVETSEFANLDDEARELVRAALKLADSLGAETAAPTGESVAATVLDFARVRNVTRIVVGKAPGSKLVGALIEGSGEISVVAIDGGAKLAVRGVSKVALPPWTEVGLAVLWIVGATAVGLLLRDRIAATNLVMVYLLAVVAVAMRYSRGAAILASVLSVASFDFFCVPPYLTFAVSDAEYLLTFAAMLTLSLAISTLTVKLRRQAELAIERENRTQSLFRLSRGLAGAQRIFDAGAALLPILKELFHSQANVFLPGDDGALSFRRRVHEAYAPPSQEEGIAQWCFDHGQNAGRDAATLPGAQAAYYPLRVREKSFAVLAMELPPRDADAAALLQALVNQTAQAMERLAALAELREAAIEAEREHLRNSLLSAVSHDLRTPLTSISAAASTLLDQGAQLPAEKRLELLHAIKDESVRLNRLVTNLLEMTRLEDGRVRVKRESCSIEEIVASTLDAMDGQAIDRKIDSRVEPRLPEVEGDAYLLSQALQNLIENALKYTPSGTPVEVTAEQAGAAVRVRVSDRGPGLTAEDEAKAFDKFYRGSAAGSTRGVGLGLAIVKAIVEAHGGQARAAKRIGGGAVFEMLLPVRRQ